MIVKILHKLGEGQEGERQGLFRQRNYPFTCSMIFFFSGPFLLVRGHPNGVLIIISDIGQGFIETPFTFSRFKFLTP